MEYVTHIGTKVALTLQFSLYNPLPSEFCRTGSQTRPVILAYIDAPCTEHTQSKMQPCPAVSRCLERTVTGRMKP
jgi:endonuclease YncB( thermonuclease family)